MDNMQHGGGARSVHKPVRRGQLGRAAAGTGEGQAFGVGGRKAGRPGSALDALMPEQVPLFEVARGQTFGEGLLLDRLASSAVAEQDGGGAGGGTWLGDEASQDSRPGGSGGVLWSFNAVCTR
jgi:hypothetical protein